MTLDLRDPWASRACPVRLANRVTKATKEKLVLKEREGNQDHQDPKVHMENQESVVS